MQIPATPTFLDFIMYQHLTTLQGARDAVISLSFSPQAKFIAAAGGQIVFVNTYLIGLMSPQVMAASQSGTLNRSKLYQFLTAFITHAIPIMFTRPLLGCISNKQIDMSSFWDRRGGQYLSCNGMKKTRCINKLVPMVSV